jgi:thiamine-phosphate diphosphorylase
MTIFLSPQRRAALRGLYVITDERMAEQKSIENHERIARAAIEGGAKIVQLRAKSTPVAKRPGIARALRSLTRRAGVLFIINDDPQLAVEADADGVHLGPDDFSPREARRILGHDKIIGVSCGDVLEARAAFENSADYIGAGAIFSTRSKADAGAPIGLENLRAIVSATPLPVAAIGGINLENISDVAQNGAAMACVISAITNCADETSMTTAARALSEKFSGAFGENL